MTPNWIAVLVTALVPMVIGFIWYNPKVLGTAWMKAAGITEEQMQGGNMGLIFGLAFLLSLMLSAFMGSLVIHQTHIFSTLMSESGFGDPNSEITAYLNDFMDKYGNNYRTFKHGALHGAIAGFFFALPLFGTNALFERKGFKYVAINVGYWIITLAIMGGIICAWQ